jgi:hypothetical protein
MVFARHSRNAAAVVSNGIGDGGSPVDILRVAVSKNLKLEGFGER